MKKILKISILFVAIVMLMLTGVKAASVSTLSNDLYAKLSAYGITSADKVKIDRYLADNSVTDAQATTILAKADEAVAVMKSEGVTNVKKLSTEKQEEIKTIAQTAANTLGLTLTFTSDSVQVYDAKGKLVETVTSTDGKLAYTGNSINAVLVVSSIAVIALAITLIIKKALAK